MYVHVPGVAQLGVAELAVACPCFTPMCLFRIHELDLQHQQTDPPRRGVSPQDSLRDHQVSPQLEGGTFLWRPTSVFLFLSTTTFEPVLLFSNVSFGSVSGSYFSVDFGSGSRSCFGSYINFSTIRTVTYILSLYSVS
jgi:hypothetical protein